MYAKFGREILSQLDGFAFQVRDANMTFLLKEKYDGVKKIVAWSMKELADKMAERGLRNTIQFLKTVNENYSAVDRIDSRIQIYDGTLQSRMAYLPKGLEAAKRAGKATQCYVENTSQLSVDP